MQAKKWFSDWLSDGRLFLDFFIALFLFLTLQKLKEHNIAISTIEFLAVVGGAFLLEAIALYIKYKRKTTADHASTL